jgi:hypothetical protein
MCQPTSLSARSAIGRQTCFVKCNINLLACSAPGRQTCWLAHEDFCLKNWATDVLAMCSVTFSVYETVSFVFGIKAMPSNQNIFIERDSFDGFIS